jgi:hypothetical protein
MNQFPIPWRSALAVLSAIVLPASAGAQTVARDAETGELRAPTAAEARALSTASPARSTPSRIQAAPADRVGLITGKVNPEPVTHADGTVEQELDASTLVYSVARRNADGTLTRECVTGTAAANKALLAKSRTSKSVVAKGMHHEDK